MPLEISSVPVEVLTEIFEYLDVSERLVACLVCKKWLQAVNCRRLLKDIDILITKSSDLFSCMTRQFCSFTFRSVIIHDRFLEFLRSHSEEFVSLTFISCIMETDPSDIENKVQSCSNLQSLEVQYCYVFVLFDSLPSLKSLKIENCSLTDYDIHKLDGTMPNLEVFVINTYIACDPRAYSRFYINGNTYENAPSSAILSFPAIKSFIAKRSRTITFLNFFAMCMDAASVLAISEIKDLKLKTIALSECLDEAFIKRLCENQPYLTGVDVKNCRRPEGGIIELCLSLTNLRELQISYSFTLNEGIIDVFQLQHLRKLDLRNCNLISASNFNAAIARTKITRLEYLNLCFTKISDVSLRYLLKCNKNIESLNLAHTTTSNDTLILICKTHMRLKYLNLQLCMSISNAGLTGDFKDDPETIDGKERCNRCNHSEVRSNKPLSNLKNLQTLILSKIPFITDEGCIKAIRLPYLSFLDLSECLQLTPSAYIQLKKQNPCLRKIVFTHAEPAKVEEKENSFKRTKCVEGSI